MYADSGIEWIDIIYDWCVLLLINLANQIGITYEEINVWLFVVLVPISLLILVLINLILFLKVLKLKKNNFSNVSK